MKPVVELVKVDKALSGRPVLSAVDLALEPGTGHVLVGENGAGKSTICKIISGDLSPDGGALLVDGLPAAFTGPRDANMRGIRSVHQESMTFPQLSVAENIFIGQELCLPWLSLFLDQSRMFSECARFFHDLGVALDPGVPMAELGMGEQRLVEILRAVMANPRLLVVDEATAGTAEPERRIIFRLLQTLMSRGVGVLLVTHRLEDLRDFGDRVTVLREGRVVATGGLDGMELANIVKLMAREKPVAGFPKLRCRPGRVVLEARNLSRTPTLEGIDLVLRCGEVVGLAGLTGSGRTALARTIAGIDRATGGDVLVDGRRVRLRQPSDAVRAGMCYVTEDPRGRGLFLSLNVAANITITDIDRIRDRFFLNLYREELLAQGFLDELGVKLPEPGAPVSVLSGGNQQKVALAKWLYRCARIFVLDEPTKGLDVETKLDVYNIINELARCGAGILLISSDLQELQGMADRILILYGGRLAGELAGREATEERILFLATGGGR